MKIYSTMAACVLVAAVAIGQSADTILVNGKIVTVDESFTIARALAIRDGKIVKVGTNADVVALADPSTDRIDLEGRMVSPGFIDGHPHMLHRGTGLTTQVDLMGVDSIAEIKRRVAAKVKMKRPGDWIVTSWLYGQPYSELPGLLREGRWPNRHDLDEVAPHNPVYIPTPFTYPNPAILNTSALLRLGITNETPAHDAKVDIDKDDHGYPTGLVDGLTTFNWNPYFQKLQMMLPTTPLEEKVKGVKMQIAKENAVGVTAVYEGHHITASEVEVVKALVDTDALDLRIQLAYQLEGLEFMPVSAIEGFMRRYKSAVEGGESAPPPGQRGGGGWEAPAPIVTIHGDDRVTMGGVTMGVGSGPAMFGLALMSDPYYDVFGRLAAERKPLDFEKAKQIVLAAARLGLRLNIAAGDEGGPIYALEVLEAANREIPIGDRRWVVQHFPYARRDAVERTKALGLMVTTSSNFEYDEYAHGMDSFEHMFRDKAEEYVNIFVPFRWWLDAGVTVAQGTDNRHPVPMFTIWQSLKRVSRNGDPLMRPSKEITREEALRLHTINGAVLMGWDDAIGSLEEGKFADLVVLDRDVLTVPVDQIRDTKVVLTMLGGKVVHGGL